ncbi:hypothetical protein AB0H57_31725 [Micromonospora sp. NPDC050686]|uniref:hypothetical protein n=1 Tax=Micromonospora sp. NPDC050686 TaxID=3154631 RepID=UPI0033EE3DFF
MSFGSSNSRFRRSSAFTASRRVVNAARATSAHPHSAQLDRGLPDGTELVVNEQRPGDDADHGLTVTAARIVLAGGLGEVVVGSITSAVHNCP